MLRRRLILAVSLMLLFMASASKARPQQDLQQNEIIPFETLVEYSYGGPPDIENPTGYVVRNRRDWKRIWKLAHIPFAIKPPRPEIDFDSLTVLAVFHGYTGGSCTTSLTTIVKSEDGLQVYAKESCPGRSCGPQPGNVLKPVEIVTFEKIEKSISKKDPAVLVDLTFFECNPPR